MLTTSPGVPPHESLKPLVVQKREAAKMLAMTVRQMDRIRAADPDFPAPIMLGPRKLRFEVSGLEAYLELRKREPMLTPMKPRSVFDLASGGTTNSQPQSQTRRSSEKAAQSATSSAA